VGTKRNEKKTGGGDFVRVTEEGGKEMVVFTEVDQDQKKKGTLGGREKS